MEDKIEEQPGIFESILFVGLIYTVVGIVAYVLGIILNWIQIK